MANRINWVDHAKGIGIFLVVLGHMIRALIESKMVANSNWIAFADQWIYAFHMPLFFLLSGLFIQKSTEKPFGIFISSRVKTIVYPYFIWSFLQGGLQIVLGKFTNNKVEFNALFKIIYNPIMQFWFLYCLFMMIVIYALLRQWAGARTPYYFLLLALLAYALRLLGTNIGSWGVLYQVSYNMIYFAIGAIWGSQSQYLNRVNDVPSKSALVASLFGFLMVAIAVVLTVNKDYLLIPFVAICGIIATICLAIFLKQFTVFNFIRDWGIFSLEIFVAHTIASAAIRIFLQKVMGVNEPSIFLIIGTGIGLYLPIALALLSQRLRFPYLFSYGYR